MPKSKTVLLALMYAGEFIDAHQLPKGLYGCAIPHLFPIGTSIETLATRAQYAKDVLEMDFGNYLNNLKECQLVPVSILVGN